MGRRSSIGFWHFLNDGIIMTLVQGRSFPLLQNLQRKTDPSFRQAFMWSMKWSALLDSRSRTPHLHVAWRINSTTFLNGGVINHTDIPERGKAKLCQVSEPHHARMLKNQTSHFIQDDTRFKFQKSFQKNPPKFHVGLRWKLAFLASRGENSRTDLTWDSL